LLDLDAAVPAEERAKYFEGLWASGRFKGRTYGIPWYIAPPVLMYNTELFKRAGLNPLDPPSSEDEMVDAARQIKDRGKVYGFMPLVDGTRLMHRFLENGLPILSADGEEDLGDARHERDDARGRSGQDQTPPGLVGGGQGQRHLRHQDQGQGERGEDAGHEEPPASARSVTPADLKVAISPRTARAARARLMQRAAPVPSPRRMPRSR